METSRLVVRAERLARSPLIGVVLVAACGWFLVSAWRSTDWNILVAAEIGWLLAASIAYGGAICAMALGLGPVSSDSLLVMFETQALKYVPGAVWQARPLVQRDGLGGAGRYLLMVILGAAAAIGLGFDGWARWAGILGFVGVSAFAALRLPPSAAARSAVGAVCAAALIGVSGAFVAAAFQAPPIDAGRALAASWALGVFALPVPSGVGVREAVATGLLGSGAAPLIVTHRIVTLVVDAALGGFAIVRRRL